MNKWLLFLILLLMMVISGCWDKKELNELAVVMGVGIDKGPKGEVRVTAQVIKPPTKQGGSAGGSSLPTWSLSANGDTLLDAVARLNEISPRRLYWSHMQMIIFGDASAREGIAPYLNWFARDLESRTSTLLAVTQGKAEDLLNQKVELGNVPTKTMADLIQTSDNRQLPTRKMTLRDFISFLATPGIDSAVDVINVKSVRGKPETYSVANIAVFRGDKLAGYISGAQRTAVEMVNNKYKNALLKVACPNEKSAFFIFQVTDYTINKSISADDEIIKVGMNIFVEGNLNDQSCAGDLLRQDILQHVEKNIQNQIKTYILNTFKQSAEMKADIYGIGRNLHRYYPHVWDSMQKDWKDILSQVQFNIKVDSNIRRNGLIMVPTNRLMEE
ncbi:Ger(x)C family spore germination protein [Paenibacillus sedimenti]|uniref:Ger(X)C family spore germination protein n=1 Tax=Paenibacillus sedimenti TaxID=2770274 RepID=A0A926KR20_9BACL|nr:Ger(x)C family spore germination protein [Paenibacillus sedimenti]MBD0380738.1 Ger(x)C family spore germination protein [Paenibacillus sedimenti]